MINLSFQPEIIAKCISNSKTALSLSSTSKLFYKIVNSNDFFQGLVESAGSEHLLNPLKNLNSFQKRYFYLRGQKLNKMETFRGTMIGVPSVHEEELEMFSFHREQCHYKLKNNTIFQKIVIPRDLHIPAKQNQRLLPFVKRSKDYLAICDPSNSCSSSVYVFSPDGSECLARCDIGDVKGEIHQLDFHEELLCITVGEFCSYKILVFNIETTEALSLELPGACCLPICFGKEYLIYIQASFKDRRPIVLPLSCLRKAEISYQEGLSKTGLSKYFPYENDFIEVVRMDGSISLNKICISNEGIVEKVIASDLMLCNDASISDSCLHDNRLFIAYEVPKSGTQIFSYDLITKNTDEPIFIPTYGTKIPFFKTRFLCVAENVHYLSMVIGTWNKVWQIQSHLTTLNYSKI